MKVTSFLSMAASIVLAAGCASTHYDSRAAADRALENNIRAQLDRYGDLGVTEPSLGIHARDGTVTLIGPVRSEKDREMIDTMVRNTSGVLAVNDEMHVLYPPTGVVAPPEAVPAVPPPPVYTTVPPELTVPPVIMAGPGAVPGEYPNSRVHAAEASDEPLAHNIVNQLSYDTVPAEWCQSVTFTASGGNVFLQGYVDGDKEHHAILSSVQHTPGVRAIYDQLQTR